MEKNIIKHFVGIFLVISTIGYVVVMYCLDLFNEHNIIISIFIVFPLILIGFELMNSLDD